MMKSKVLFTSLILTALTALLSVSGLAGVGPLANPALQSGAPTVVSYQGQVTVGGSPYSGTGYFKFAIVNAAGDATYWSNDGTSENGGEPTNGTPLPVSNGLFNALLGDTSLTNMTQPLAASVFNGTERYLRVWFSSDNVNFQLLSPDRRIAAVPYALQAQEAANADTVDGQHADAFSSASHSHDGLLPPGAMVLSSSDNDTTLINAGFSYTGQTIELEWSVRADMPTGRHALAAAAVDGVVYVIGGRSSSTSYETANEAYDPATNSWSARADMTTGRRHLAAAAVDRVIYAIGGQSSSTSYETANEAYDPATNSWNTRVDMPTGRYVLAAAEVNGVIYAIGGRTSSNLYETANEAYDPATNSWSAREDMTTGRRLLAAAAVDGVIYAIGGESSSTITETKNEAYDPAANSWTTKAAMPTGRHGLAAAAVDGVIYAIGGWTGVIETANEAYDPATDSWNTRAAMPTGRFYPAAAAVDGVIYAIGGHSSSTNYETKNEAYTPALFVYIKD
jgi:N-acetylneuraminic acid mutarotase